MLLSMENVLKIMNDPYSELTNIEKNQLLLGDYSLEKLPDKKIKLTFL